MLNFRLAINHTQRNPKPFCLDAFFLTNMFCCFWLCCFFNVSAFGLELRHYIYMVHGWLIIMYVEVKENLTLAENIYPVVESDAKISNRGTFKKLTNTVYSCLSQLGNDSLVFRILEQEIFNQLVSCLLKVIFLILHWWSPASVVRRTLLHIFI